MKSSSSARRANVGPNSSSGTGKDEMISTNLSTLKGALNPPHPPCLPGRETVMQDLTPLDDENFFRYGNLRRNHHIRRNNARTNNHHWRASSNLLERQHRTSSSSSLNPGRLGISNRDSSKYQATDICAQLASQSMLMSQVSQMINAHAFQTQVRAILDPNPSDPIFSSPKVVRNVSKVQSFQAGLSASGAHRRRLRADPEEQSKHRLAQNSYMRMLIDKYIEIRLWTDVSGHVEVKYKKVDLSKNQSKYIDLYPKGSYRATSIPEPLYASSRWYEGALYRGHRSMKEVIDEMHAHRLKGIMDLDLISERLNKDPWMYDDLVYMFVCAGRRDNGDGCQHPSDHCDGYISMPTLPPHFMDDEIYTDNLSPKIQMSSWSHTGGHRSSQQTDSRRRAKPSTLPRNRGEVSKTNVGLGGKQDCKCMLDENDRNRAKGRGKKTHAARSSTKASKRGQDGAVGSEKGGAKNKDEKTKSRGVSKYTTQLMTLPEIVVITSNGRSGMKSNEKGEESKPEKEKKVMALFDDMKEREGNSDEKVNSARHNVFDKFLDDAASEESLFREIADVVERRGDLSGSSVCNSGDGSQAPSLADAPSSISPHVQCEAATTTCGWGDKNSKEEWFEGIGAAIETEQQSHVDDSNSFIRRDLWSSTEESKDTGFSLFPSIWRTDDSIF